MAEKTWEETLGPADKEAWEKIKTITAKWPRTRTVAVFKVDEGLPEKEKRHRRMGHKIATEYDIE